MTSSLRMKRRIIRRGRNSRTLMAISGAALGLLLAAAPAPAQFIPTDTPPGKVKTNFYGREPISAPAATPQNTLPPLTVQPSPIALPTVPAPTLPNVPAPNGVPSAPALKLPAPTPALPNPAPIPLPPVNKAALPGPAPATS